MGTEPNLPLCLEGNNRKGVGVDASKQEAAAE